MTLRLEKSFHIYRSSAGSGKTRTLAREYIILALRNPEYFKYTLAVSFANKSSQEMKNRIIQYLGEFAKRADGTLSREIQQALGIDAMVLQRKSQEVLSRILHQYTQFSISTIDAFFQRVIRSFTRESGLLGNFRLEVENDRVLEEVIAELIDELGPNRPDLTRWVIEYSTEKLDKGDNWNIADSLRNFAKEIFKENYKAIESEIKNVSPAELNSFLANLREEKNKFLREMKTMADEAMSLLGANGIGAEDFNYKDEGTPITYFRAYADGKYYDPKARILAAAEDASVWAPKKSFKRERLTQLAESKLRPLLKTMLHYSQTNSIRYHSAELVEKNFYAYGLLTDINRKLLEYKSENNLMLLSDGAQFLNGVINDSDTPFIYEKVGSFYRHYLIDEFQDTSGLQWSNFKPLIQESLDQNNRSLVVGDVKQSIYRWRGSELQLLQSVVEAEVGSQHLSTFPLTSNYRSAENIVQFNNHIFSSAAQQVAKATNHSLPSEAYSDVIQSPVNFMGKGFVQVEFLPKRKDVEEGEEENEALGKLPQLIERLQLNGVSPGDITILVRKNKEGQEIANYLMRFKGSERAVPGVRYEVVSNESLRLDAASSVLLLLSALRYLSNPDDAIARAELVYEAADQKQRTPVENEFRFFQAGRKSIKGLVPDEFSNNLAVLVKLSLFELTETLIRIFKLGEDTRELSYLQSFQDVVLEFGAKDKNDIASFLKWWEEIKEEKSIQVAANTDAINIFTIHKSKGLQFKYVIVPFCSWRMGHEIDPLLWVKSHESPFDQLGYLAVRNGSELESSFFKADYLEEFTRIYVDNLNLLYVALTRAEEGLIVMAPLPAPQKEGDYRIRDAGQLLHQAIAGSKPLLSNYDQSSNTFRTGAIEKLAPPINDPGQSTVMLDHYHTYDWRKNLLIRRQGKEFFEEGTSDQRTRINYGMFIHSILSRIKHKDEVDGILQKANYEGLIIQDELKPLSQKIKKMMADSVIGQWFSNDWEVRTETPVILPSGKLARMDRVISKDVTAKGQHKRKAIIIDYKTGKKKNHDRIQIEEYTQILSNMGYVDVEGYLLYVDSLEVFKVVSKMNLSFGF